MDDLVDEDSDILAALLDAVFDNFPGQDVDLDSCAGQLNDDSHIFSPSQDDYFDIFATLLDGDFGFFTVQDVDLDNFTAQRNNDSDIIEALAAAELPEVDLARDHTAFSEALHKALAATKELEQSEMEVLGCCKDHCGQYGILDDFLRPVAEIKEVMEAIRRSGNAVGGQTWMLCKLCNCVSTCVKFGNNLRASFSGPNRNFILDESMLIMNEEKGVVGKAASSHHHIIYCEDVNKFHIRGYPLAHFERKIDCSSCCAISLQSMYTGDQVYILEFFLDPNRELWAALVSIFQAVIQNSRTFKPSSGKEIGGTLSVQLIDASSPDKIAILENWLPDLTLTIGVNSGKVVRPYFLQGPIGETSVYGTDDSMTGMETSFQDTSMEEAHGQSFSTVKSEFRMTVKAYYGDAFVTFQLSDSLGIDALKELVSQRFNLEDGTYNITYQDEANDPVLIECDEDVHEYISCSTSLGVYLLSIELKAS